MAEVDGVVGGIVGAHVASDKAPHVGVQVHLDKLEEGVEVVGRDGEEVSLDDTSGGEALQLVLPQQTAAASRRGNVKDVEMEGTVRDAVR